METPNTAYYIPNLVRNDDQADVTVEVVPVNANGVRGESSRFTIDWLYENGDTEKLSDVTVPVNICPWPKSPAIPLRMTANPHGRPLTERAKTVPNGAPLMRGRLDDDKTRPTANHQTNSN